MKYTDEQLSRILSAAAMGTGFHGGLICGGWYAPGLPCCLVQAAELVTSSFDAMAIDPDRVAWFDKEVSTSEYGDPDAMLRALEDKGWA